MTGFNRPDFGAKMTSEEISAYLHDQEQLSVEFLIECPGLGFLVGADQDEATIPKGYRAMIPYWLAAILGMPQSDGRSIVKVTEPPWLQSLGPGARIETERSYFFSASIGLACRDATVPKRLIELAKERVKLVLDTALQTRRRHFDSGGDTVFLTEEKELIAESQRAVETFAHWRAPNRF
jgi:hypothetical protein